MAASIVIFMLSALDTGHSFFDFSAHSRKRSLLMPGILAFTTKCDSVILLSSNVTVDVVIISSGVNPASPNKKLSLIVKQPACAAAINSSGFVPFSSS